MCATIIPEKHMHCPVLLNEIISIISPQYGGTYIDCTFGQGGYSSRILKFPNTKIIALDRDQDTIKKALEIKKNFDSRFIFKNLKFSQLNNLKLKKENIKAVLFDLGYSFTQIKDKKKKLSFDAKGELNMRMGLNDFSASDAINKLNQNELEKIFKFFGEERESKKIAINIIKERESKKINTEDLVKIIDKTKRIKNYKIHSATKVFQALRIFVNKEISELICGLVNATKIIKKDGIIAIVSFHSIEDKIVKYFFKSLSEDKSISRYIPKKIPKEKLLKLIIKKPIVASPEELKQNPSSRSAKLRYAIKKYDFFNFETDIQNKFKYLLDIEKYSEKL